MERALWCPKCKQKLEQVSDAFRCKYCQSVYPDRDGYVDFLNLDFYAGEFSRAEINALLAEIDKVGYYNALQNFFTKYPNLRQYILDSRRGDWQCHCVGSDYSRCLDIGSGLGNLSEILSRNFNEVYSLEAVKERIQFQKRRYGNSNIKNIVIVRGNGINLPFPDNFFDLVVCNGVLEWVALLNTNLSPRDAQISFLSEIKRVLSQKGCAYIGIENRFGFPFILGALDHSGLRYTSLMPRWLASAIVKRYGKAGGIYGDITNEKETIGYATYTYSLSGYKKLFNDIGFKTKSFWVIPSYNEPYISSKTEDSIALKGYIRYFLDTSGKFKIPLSLLYRLDRSVVRAVACFFAPSFLFYCYKDQIPETFDDTVTSKTNLSHFVRITTGRGVMYILFDNKSKFSKVVHLKRPSYRPRDQIPTRDKSSQESKKFQGDTWVEPWIEGRQLNPLRFKDSQLALKWLFDYQKKNQSEQLAMDEVKSEDYEDLKKTLALIPEIGLEKLCDFINSYRKYIHEIDSRKTSEHGDFFYGNIIVNNSNSTIHVIDWEYARSDGDPFFDLGFYLLSALSYPTGLPLEIRNNMSKKSKFRKVLEDLKPLIDQHYGYNVAVDKLVKYACIRFFARKYLERGKFDSSVLQYKQILNILLSEEFKLFP